MATLSVLLSSLSPHADLKGRQFERITKWFLLNDPVRKAQFREVWLWNEWPDADGPDIGIDLVAERRDRSLVAIQVKCFAAEGAGGERHGAEISGAVRHDQSPSSLSPGSRRRS